MASVGAWCFNCDFSTRYTIGGRLPRNLSDLMTAVHVPQTTVLRASAHAKLIQRVIDQAGPASPIALQQHGIFPATTLPRGAKPLEVWAADPAMADNKDLCDVINYLGTRGSDIANAMTYYWTPEKKNGPNGMTGLNRRLIIPMRYGGKLVGWTGRSCDPGTNPKYHTHSPEGFLFNADVLNDPLRKYVIVLEGPMDAIAADAVSPLGAVLNDTRVRWLNDNDKIKIVVADRDKKGARKGHKGFIDTAIENGWHVAFPRLADGKGFSNWWESEVKDVAQAVEKYGRLYVLRSIIQSATDHKREIEFRRNRLY